MGQPLYVDRGGEIVFAQPYAFDHVRSHVFVLPASEAALREYVCDRYFNQPSGGQVRLRPAGPLVMLVFSHFDAIRSTEPPFSEYGSFEEVETAVYVLCVDEIHHRLCWAFPYLFVDSQYPMAAGREVYGFPKNLGRFQLPAEPDGPEPFIAETVVLKELSPQSRGVWAPVAEVRRTSDAGESPGRRWDNLADAAREWMACLGASVDTLGDVRLMWDTAGDLMHGRQPMIFLKEFRDAVDGTKACYQAVVEAGAQITHFHGGGLLTGTREVTIPDWQSHPIRRDLGLPEGPIQPLAQWWAEYDFTLGDAVERWRA